MMSPYVLDFMTPPARKSSEPRVLVKAAQNRKHDQDISEWACNGHELSGNNDLRLHPSPEAAECEQCTQ